jgi:hypothetical protein
MVSWLMPSLQSKKTTRRNGHYRNRRKQLREAQRDMYVMVEAFQLLPPPGGAGPCA